MNLKIFIPVIFIILAILGFFLIRSNNGSNDALNSILPLPSATPQSLHTLSIESLRQKEYPGSEIKIEQTLAPGSNYQQYVASYISEGLKIYGLLTIPTGEKPERGWPVIIFNHGYIPPTQYRTTERYVAYVDNFARNGYIVFKSDYRGHGSSEGRPSGAYFDQGYLTDVLNAVSSIKKHPEVNPEKIGMWGHSMGGFITMNSMVINKDIKAGVVWGGVVGSYQDIFEKWWNRRSNMSGTSFASPSGNRSSRQSFIQNYGQPKDNPEFWNKISATAFLSDISGPIQLHHGTADETVPHTLSESYSEALKNAGKEVELYLYEDADHNISDPSFTLAMQRSISFFDKYLKK